MRKVWKYFLYVCFSPAGRINRTWWCLGTGVFSLFGTVMTILELAPLSPVERVDKLFLFDFIDVLVLPLTYSIIVMSVKRFRDTNRSGWNLLWVFFPFGGALYILIVCIFFKGTAGKNKYGEPSSLIDWNSFDNDTNKEDNSNERHATP